LLLRGAVLHKLVAHPPTVQQTAGYCLSSRRLGDSIHRYYDPLYQLVMTVTLEVVE